jgi:diguanylate cyclase (GGDEF)-like protein
VRMKDKVDYPVRYGGDEFAVLMTQVTDLGVVLDVANRFRTRVLTRKWWGIHPQLESDFRPRPDIGVACLRMSSLENLTDQSKLQAIVESWIEKADKLMYQAKREDEIFLRCYEYDPDSDRHLSEADPQIFRLELEQDRRHQ